MAKTKTPAPRRAGTATGKARAAAQARLRNALKLVEHDREALELIARLMKKLAGRSRVRRR